MAPVGGLRRVSLRRRLSGGSLGDVVGDLVEQSSSSLVVRPEDGPDVVVRRSDVVAVRDVPPQVVRPASSPERLMRLLAGHWPGTETARLGGWLLRAGDGFTKRANSAMTAGDPGCTPAEARRRVARWYAERDLPAQMQVPGPPRQVEGWSTVDDVEVLVGDVRSMAMTRVTLPEVDVADEPSAGWCALWRGGAACDPAARAVLTAYPARYLTVTEDERIVACARLVVDRRWAHVSCVEVERTARGRGSGRAVMEAVVAEAVARPAAEDTRFVVVEVERVNEAAGSLYASMGMRVHHRYHYQRLERDGDEV